MNVRPKLFTFGFVALALAVALAFCAFYIPEKIVWNLPQYLAVAGVLIFGGLAFYFFYLGIFKNNMPIVNYLDEPPPTLPNFSKPFTRNLKKTIYFYHLPIVLFVVAICLYSYDYFYDHQAFSKALTNLPLTFFIFLILILWLLIMDRRFSGTRYEMAGSVLKKISKNHIEDIDLLDVARYIYLPISGGDSLTTNYLVLIHRDGKKFMKLPVDSYDFSELEKWATSELKETKSLLFLYLPKKHNN